MAVEIGDRLARSVGGAVEVTGQGAALEALVVRVDFARGFRQTFAAVALNVGKGARVQLGIGQDAGQRAAPLRAVMDLDAG